MKGFIEVTDRISKTKVFINVAHIQSVTPMHALATIRLSNPNSTVDAKETYEQIIALIQDALRE